jgi:N-acyl-D-amino-acid deacylase
VLIRGAEVADGSGAALVAADLLLYGDRIASVGPPGGFDGLDGPVTDASGLVVAPGFIDVHSHADNAPWLPPGQYDTSKITQGVTTEVVGNCGYSLAPVGPDHEAAFTAFWGRRCPPVDWGWHTFAEFLAVADARGHVANYAPLVGHGALRFAILGLARMRALTEEALSAGAFGMSSGLVYRPGLFASTAELTELARALPAASGPGRVYATHMRDEGSGLLASIEEALRIGAAAGCRVQVSHLKSSGRPNWGRVAAALAMLDQARADGPDVGQDAYPYDRSSTGLIVCLPRWALTDGDDAVLARLADPGPVGRMRAEVAGTENALTSAGPDGILIASTRTHDYEGRTLAEIAAELGIDPFDALVRVLRGERLSVSIVISSMSEADVTQVLAHPATMIGSDGLPPGRGGKPHPRLYGTFPRVLGRYVRERGVLTLPEAIARMTTMPARAFGLTDRGRIAAGAIADLVAFDPARITDTGDYRDPVRAPAGIAWVMQDGQFAVRDGQWLGNRLGRRLQPR